MDKIKYYKAKKLEDTMFQLEGLSWEDGDRFCYVDNWTDRNIRKFPECFREKLQSKINEWIKNELSLLEEEFNSL